LRLSYARDTSSVAHPGLLLTRRLFDWPRHRLRTDLDQQYAAYAHRTGQTRDAHKRSESNIHAPVSRTACDTVSEFDTRAAVPTLNTLRACPFARYAHNSTHTLRTGLTTERESITHGLRIL
jgi:predicted DsbA family dithiol-disulfide isomerase